MNQRKSRKLLQPPNRSVKALCQSWYAEKAPLFQCAGKLWVVLIFLNLVSFAPICQQLISASAIEDAKLSGFILKRMGEGLQISGGILFCSQYAITVLPTCTGIEFFLFFCALVVSVPARFGRKIVGLMVGVTFLFAVNLFRIVSLYFIRVHFPGFFEIAHEELGGLLLILASVFLSAIWIGWAQQGEISDVTT